MKITEAELDEMIKSAVELQMMVAEEMAKSDAYWEHVRAVDGTAQNEDHSIKSWLLGPRAVTGTPSTPHRPLRYKPS